MSDLKKPHKTWNILQNKGKIQEPQAFNAKSSSILNQMIEILQLYFLVMNSNPIKNKIKLQAIHHFLRYSSCIAHVISFSTPGKIHLTIAKIYSKNLHLVCLLFELMDILKSRHLGGRGEKEIKILVTTKLGQDARTPFTSKYPLSAS